MFSVSRHLFLSLTSKEDKDREREERMKKRKERQQKRKGGRRKNKHSRINEALDEDGMGSIAVATQAEEDDEDLDDCRTANRKAIKTTLSGSFNNYIPECENDGTYKQIQCYKVKYNGIPKSPTNLCKI